MKVVILAGGFGSRLAEYTDVIPKPMVEVGGKPILWHIMKIYSYYGFNDFIICLGYKGKVIRDYFIDKLQYGENITVDFVNGTLTKHSSVTDPWKVSLINTGENSMTGGRIKRIQSLINEPFLLTYGDGVANIDIKALIEHHRKHNKVATVTAVQPAGRFGGLEIQEDVLVTSFIEKRRSDSPWINGGFFVCEPDIFNYIKDDSTVFESDVLELLAAEKQLTSYKHHGFWECMDTVKERNNLNNLWNTNKAEWKIW